jgi:hypothetical protein
MKKSLLGLFALLFSAVIMPVISQGKVGTLTMEIVDVSSDNEQMAAGLEMMKGTQMVVSYKDKESMTKLNMMGGMVKTDIKMNADGDMDMFMDMMGQKMWIASTKLEMDKAKAQNPAASDFDMEYDESDRKNIAGFDCYKMIMTTPGNADFKLEAYVTEEIDINAQVIQNVDISTFKGFPLEYTLDMGVVKMTFSTTDFKKTVDESVFNVKTDGYKKMTMAEFQSQMGGMGGGFGF